MKKLLFALCLTLSLSGCTPTTAPTQPAPPLIPGASNQFDQDTYRALATAHAFAVQASSDPSTLTPTTKTLLNQFIEALNAADLLYSSYHAGTATQAAMQQALINVQVNQANYTSATTGGK